MVMWRDLSFKELWKLLLSAGDYPGEYQSFKELMHTTVRSLGTACRQKLVLPSLSDWKSHNVGLGTVKFNEILTFVVDGTSLPVYKPANHHQSRLMWVHYKGHTAYRYFILTCLDGTIVYCSRLAPGLVTDSTELRISNIYQQLGSTYRSSILDSSSAVDSRNELEKLPLALMGDKGYIDITAPAHWKLFVTATGRTEQTNRSNQTLISNNTTRVSERSDTTSASHLQDLLTLNSETVSSSSSHPSPSKAEFPIDCAKARVIVEISIGVVKRFRKLTAGNIRVKDDPDTLQAYVDIAVHTANILIQNRLKDS